MSSDTVQAIPGTDLRTVLTAGWKNSVDADLAALKGSALGGQSAITIHPPTPHLPPKGRSFIGSVQLVADKPTLGKRLPFAIALPRGIQIIGIAGCVGNAVVKLAGSAFTGANLATVENLTGDFGVDTCALNLAINPAAANGVTITPTAGLAYVEVTQAPDPVQQIQVAVWYAAGPA